MPKAITWYLFFIAGFLLFIAINIQAGWLFVLDFLILAFIIAAFLLPCLWTMGKWRVERFAQRIFEGDMSQVILRLTNASSFDKHFLILEDRFPANKISYSLARDSSASGDSPRSHRNKNSDPVSLFIPLLRSGETVELRYEQKALMRGVYAFQNLFLRSLGPAGFFEWKRKLPCPGKLVVYPLEKPFPLSLEDVVPAPQSGEKGISFGKGDGDEFFGVREYEPGDRLRAVHWPSSAKVGKLMIRDMMRTHPALYTLYLDADERWKGDPFEQCVKMAAYSVREILRQGHWLRMFRNGNAEPIDWWGSLDFLASVKPDQPFPLAKQVEHHLPVLLAQRHLVFFTVAPSTFSPEAWKFVNWLSEGFVRLKFVFLKTNEKDAASALVEWLASQSVSSALVPSSEG